MEVLLIEPSFALRKTTKLYAKFLENKDRKAKFHRIGRTYQTPLQLHNDIVVALCGLNGDTAQDVIISILSAGLEKESNAPLAAIARFGDADAF